ncbi:3-hydroxybutyrate oligomer hydrolase family protein [Burkholderia multivorans]|uniref:3-hydroxybutyrate oligomer hydrolase family protein n=1 Tax=Burkholderia multivorans TaxID=87883 RepID=UPI001C224829|nr:D-(-)-3-hydroxybutyrate oligomer hydrolase [Burkholderia multivorans]MBU9622993.1 D-(-)-3-hydroxybutyrate oligomer hydrolase [Burkholderia multivorans]
MRSDRTERAWDASLRGVARVGHLGDFDLLHGSMCGSQAIGAISVTYASASTRSRGIDNLGNFGFASAYGSRSRRPMRPRRCCAGLTCRSSRRADRH